MQKNIERAYLYEYKPRGAVFRLTRESIRFVEISKKFKGSNHGRDEESIGAQTSNDPIGNEIKGALEHC